MEGYLYQRGKSKVWYLRYDAPAIASGKRNQKNVRIGRVTKRQAEAKKRELLRRLDDGSWIEERGWIILGPFLEEWLASQSQYLAANTHERYSSLVRLHVIPIIGTMRLSKIRPEHIRRVYDVARGKGLSGTTCLHIHRVLHTALNYAVKVERIIQENPVQLIKAPRASEHEMTPMNPDQIQSLIESAKGTRLEGPVALAAVTGLRRGELLALRWANVDLEQHTLFVAESLEQTRACGVRVKGPKSRSSRRRVPLSPEAVELLCVHKTMQEEARKQALYYVDNDLVFCNPDGTPWPPDTFTVQFRELANLVGLKGFRFHDVRHAFATLNLANGTPIKEVQLLMGHSTASTTLSVYARAVEGLGREAVNRLSRSLLGAQG